ncbi:MAG TPA: thiamine pyrophosphate-dependent enzyme [Myxococcaceae bacterium]|nr:thiamine pyrophosphate-dependent enzyme [Myxococcaceae bacterium]
MTRLSPEGRVTLYREMVRVRTLDERMMTLQRQGRVGFYGACFGQEAACLGSAYALRPTDWIFPALREGAAMLLRGFSLTTYLAQAFGTRADLAKGRQMPSHPSAREVNQVSWSSCIGSQLPHAVGMAWAARLRGEDTVAMAYLGDGATSSADFHVAMNAAGVARAPVVFVCQNNHWSISVPADKQTASQSMAIKAQAYGFPGEKVDGNDVEAVYAAAAGAVERARSGGGPTLIEAETYRMGAHSSSDDPTRYRDAAEVEAWAAKDPIERVRRGLIEAGLWDEPRDQALRAEALSQVNAAIEAAEHAGAPDPATLFEDVYAELPWHLREQAEGRVAALPQRA